MPTPVPIPRKASLRGVSYRRIALDDLAFLRRVYRSTRDEELKAIGWSEAQIETFIDMQFDAQHTHYQTHYAQAAWLIIEKEGAPCGRLYLDCWANEDRIVDIALLPQQRGQGIGSAILADLLHDAEARGQAVTIHVENNSPALRLYERLGFKSAGQDGVYRLLTWNKSNHL